MKTGLSKAQLKRARRLVAEGLLTEIDGRFELTSAGCRAIGMPEDMTLLFFGLQTMIEEAFDERATNVAGRPYARRKQ